MSDTGSYLVYSVHGTPRVPAPSLPEGYRFELWEPTLQHVVPPGQPWRYAAWWLFDRAHVFTNRDYAVGLVWKGDTLAHRLGIFPRWYRWPFMERRNDLQFGDLWTDPAHRGLGLAICALRMCMEARGDRTRTFWYLTHATNVASIRTAERAGFHCVDHATRTRRLGLRPLGQYTLSNATTTEAPAGVDYSSVTELGGDLGSRAQLRRSYGRYYFAGRYCEGKAVLEVACGGGQGLGYLARRARSVTGLDIDRRNLAVARETYRGRDGVTIVEGNAQALPFDAETFDVVLLFEAIYYLPDPERFVIEARRVLRPGGVLLICTMNKDVPGFNPGAFTHRHFGVRELAALLRSHGFVTETYASAATRRTLGARAFRASKRAAVHLKLIPNTLRMRAVLKRLVFGPLAPLPHEIADGVHDYDQTVAVSSAEPTTHHEVILGVGRLAR